MPTLTTTSTSTTHVQPRRRAARGTDQPDRQPHSTPCPSKDMTVPKGATFHTPKLPTTSTQDPVLNIKTLPSRTLTSPDALQHLCDESEKRVQDLLASFNNLSTAGTHLETDFEHQNVLPVPNFLGAHAASKSDLIDSEEQNDQDLFKHSATSEQANHHHGSDSGLGSSIGTNSDDESSPIKRRMLATGGTRAVFADPNKARRSVYKPLSTPVVINQPNASAASATGHILSDFAAKVIKLHIIDPLLNEPTLREFHPLVNGLPQRIGSRKITCLRDLEKTLIFLAPVSTDLDSTAEGVLAHCFVLAKTKSKSPASYLDFCEVSIQCIHTTVNHLNDIDQRRPTDRPYTNNYFVDLVEQVRAYARIMARSRSKQAKGQPLDEDDIHPGDKIKLEGGVAEDGKPIEIVRERDGRIIAVDAGYNEIDEDMLDDEVKRSMARKRKCDIGKVEYRACRECGKVYTRPCDLTKHEKTHSRPWKCSDEDCKYYELGWPTEKERDRHVNDKHSDQPALYRCLYKPCTYTSKRESNCKQHMEKAHGWEYVRSKSKKGTKLVATKASPPTTLLPTPSSERNWTPVSAGNSNQSPAISSYDAYSPADSGFGSTGDSVSSYPTTFNPSPASASAGPDFNFNGYDKDFAYESYLSPEASTGRRESLNTPPREMTPGSAGAPVITFEDDFAFSNVNIDWSTMGNVFQAYSIPQQPTPAASDFALDFALDFAAFDPKDKSIVTTHELSPDYTGEITNFNSSEDDDVLMGESQGYHDFVAQSRSRQQQAQSASDFTLFGEVNSGDSSASTVAAMFPELGDVDVGGQFNAGLNAGMFDQMSDEEMDRYLYGDGN